jgi:hypothetical protein
MNCNVFCCTVYENFYRIRRNFLRNMTFDGYAHQGLASTVYSSKLASAQLDSILRLGNRYSKANEGSNVREDFELMTGKCLASAFRCWGFLRANIARFVNSGIL